MLIDKHTAKERILMIAKREFAEKGFNGARLGDIAKKAGVNKALIHYYFNNKEVLYENVIARVFGIGRRKGIAIIAPSLKLTASQKLYFMLNIIYEAHRRKGDHDTYRLFFWEMIEGGKYHETAMSESFLPIKEIFVRIIRDGIAAGEFEQTDPDLIVMFIMSFIDSYHVYRTVFRDSRLFHEIFGEKDEDQIFDFLVMNTMKCLSKPGAPVLMPDIPDDLEEFIRVISDNIQKTIEEGYTQEVIMKIREFLLGD